MTEVIILLYYIISILTIIYIYQRYFITPNLLFLASQLLMFSGITEYTNEGVVADVVLIYIYMITMVIFSVSSLFWLKKFSVSISKIRIVSQDDINNTQYLAIWAMIVCSLLGCVYLFFIAGENVFLNSIYSIINAVDYSTKVGRKEVLNVIGVGYIYQLRTIILPILTLFLLDSGNKHLKNYGRIIFPFMIIFLLGTGQRGGFVVFLLIWLVYLLFMHKFMQIKNIKRIIKTIFFFGGIFAITTILNGRVKDGSNIIQAMLVRFFGDNQYCAVYGFRYIYYENTQWGLDWLLQLHDILPGKNIYTPLSIKIFAMINGGSTAGTAPSCIWGSVFYNWSWFGVVIIPFLLAFLYTFLFKRFIQKDTNKLRLLLYSGSFVILGMWIADGPIVLFNQGFVTIALMSIILRYCRKIQIRR